MTDSLTKVQRSERMALIRHRDTKPERQVRGMLHRLGFRYRLQGIDLPGTPDIVFRSRRKVIFVHGCFWHRHDDPLCKLARLPKSRPEYWMPKLEGNRARDFRHQSELDAKGWRWVVVWECELRHEEQLKNTLIDFLDEDRP